MSFIAAADLAITEPDSRQPEAQPIEMTKPTRTEILSRVIPLAPQEGTRDDRGSQSEFTWEQLAPVIEGLAVGARPIGAATRPITERYNLGPRGSHILSLISNGVSYPLELATALRVGRSLITAELGRLVDAGLITSTQDQTDKRRYELALTDLGIKASAEVRAEMARILQRNLGSYSPDELRLFADMLRDSRRLTAEEERD